MFLKKIILFCISILIGLTGTINASANGNSQDNYKIAIQKLYYSGLIVGYDDLDWFYRQFNVFIVRGEVAALCSNILNLKKEYYEDCVFNDCHEHWAKQYLNGLYEKNIIKGYSDGTFKPSDNISEYDAIVMLIRTLGYEEAAIENGGYPTGYFKTAENLGLLKNTKITTEENNQLKYGEYFLLLINALETKMHGKEDWYLWDECGKNNRYIKVIAKADEIVKDKSNVNDELVDYLKVTIDEKEEKYQLFFEHDLSEFAGKNVIMWYSKDFNDTKYLIDIILP